MTLSRALIVGASAAGLSAAEGLPAHGYSGEVTLVGEEAGLPYDRPPPYTIGLVDRRAPAGAALDGTLALAAAIAINGPLALRATKEVLRRQQNSSDAEFWDRQETVAAVPMASEDALEGSRAFTEKRPPRWQGR
jgi:enoyl-CoA hydratase